MRNVTAYFALCAALLAAAPLLLGKDSQTPSSNDRIDVVAHVLVPGGSVAQLTSGVHWRRDYLYVSHGTKSPITILDVTDPTVPRVIQTHQFSGVTAMLKDEARGLVYLANSEGLWGLHLNPATDVELEKEYGNYIRYYH